MTYFKKLTLLGLLAIFCHRSFAQANTPSLFVDSTLTVGVTVMPPFVIQDDEKLWDGISVQLWREIADQLDITYEFKEVPPDLVVVQVARGDLDIGLVAPATAQQEQQVDFSHSYLHTTLGVAGSTTQSLKGILTGIFTQRFFSIVVGLSVLLLIVGTLVWLLERKTNEDNFGGERRFWHGIGAGFWWAGVTMTTIGYGDKAPVTFWGRAVALLWMLVAMAVTASLTATLVSAVGIGPAGSISVPSDLRDMKVGSVAETNAAEYLQEERIKF